ncbi:MAG: hypothetical protein FWF78_07600 [Defluviitaleaceae bacterium]|nr:hypothetical protein [Defluviitaleaceae bacterium]
MFDVFINRAIWFLLAAAALGVGYYLCGFVFLYLHGMGQWPFILFVFGLIVLFISVVLNGRKIMIFIPLGYVAGFAVGMVLPWEVFRLAPDGEWYYFDQSWVAWTVTYLIFMAVGLIFDFIKAKRRAY